MIGNNTSKSRIESLSFWRSFQYWKPSRDRLESLRILTKMWFIKISCLSEKRHGMGFKASEGLDELIIIFYNAALIMVKLASKRMFAARIRKLQTLTPFVKKLQKNRQKRFNRELNRPEIGKQGHGLYWYWVLGQMSDSGSWDDFKFQILCSHRSAT